MRALTRVMTPPLKSLSPMPINYNYVTNFRRRTLAERRTLDAGVSKTDVIAGRYDAEFAEVARVFRDQITHTDGGASVAVYLRGRLVVDLGAAFADPTGTLAARHPRDVLEHDQGRHRHRRPCARRPRASRLQRTRRDVLAGVRPERQGGITVRQVFSHSAGLHRLSTIIDHGSKILDWST